MKIHEITHRKYNLLSPDWTKWRLAYEGGSAFINRFLKKYSTREEKDEFALRKETTYNPAFAASAINDVKNSIYCRMVDIIRIGGPKTYQVACKGQEGGIDNVGSSMDTFLGQKILPELLVMSRVGVFVDKPPLKGDTLIDSKGLKPYLYYYKAEDIRSWLIDHENKLISVLLRDTIETYDKETGLPDGEATRFRRLWIDDEGFVRIQFYDETGNSIDLNNNPSEGYGIQLALREIPFIIAEISESLMKDIADYQIGLLNLASSNLAYGLKANFPFYTEQYDPRAENIYARPGEFESPNTGEEGCVSFIDSTTGERITTPVAGDPEGTQSNARAGNDKEIKVGAGSGRRYPKGVERPDFIHPSSEPLKAALELKKDMQDDIRMILNTSVANLSPGYSSAASKEYDSKGLEAGLSYIGLELQGLERRIAHIWVLYEGGEEPTITYPKRYSLKNQKERNEEADSLTKQRNQVTSRTAKREFNKQIAHVLLGDKIPHATLITIEAEIDKAEYTESDPEIIAKDVEIGLVDLVTASTARGYEGQKHVDLAAAEHAERAARIAKAQSEAANAARGVNDLSIDKDGSKEKDKSKDTTLDKKVTDKTRGEGK